DVDHLLLGAIEQAIGVLHAGDSGGQRAPQYVRGDAAHPDPADLALVAQGDHLGQLVVEVDDLVALGLHTGPEVLAPQIDHRYAVEAQLAQVVFHGRAQLGGLLRRRQRDRFFAGPSRADLADDDKVVGVGGQRRADPAVHLAGAVEGRGVDVVDAE